MLSARLKTPWKHVTTNSHVIEEIPSFLGRRCLGSSGKRKRKTRSPHHKTPLTTRERIRWLQERNAIPDKSSKVQPPAPLDVAGDTVAVALTQARERFFSFWRGGDAAIAQNGSKMTRPPIRVGPKMDGKWWFWNICFALVPAVLIGTYCEFLAKPRLMEFNRSMIIEKKRKELGESYDPDQDPELLALKVVLPSFMERLQRAPGEIFQWIMGGEIPERSDSPPPPLEATTARGEESSSGRAVKQLRENVKPLVGRKSNDDAEDLDEMRRRIEALEALLAEKENPSKPDMNPPSPKKYPSEEDANVEPGLLSTVSTIAHRVVDFVALQVRQTSARETPTDAADKSIHIPQKASQNVAQSDLSLDSQPKGKQEVLSLVWLGKWWSQIGRNNEPDSNK